MDWVSSISFSPNVSLIKKWQMSMTKLSRKSSQLSCRRTCCFWSDQICVFCPRLSLLHVSNELVQILMRALGNNTGIQSHCGIHVRRHDENHFCLQVHWRYDFERVVDQNVGKKTANHEPFQFAPRPVLDPQVRCWHFIVFWWPDEFQCFRRGFKFTWVMLGVRLVTTKSLYLSTLTMNLRTISSTSAVSTWKNIQAVENPHVSTKTFRVELFGLRRFERSKHVFVWRFSLLDSQTRKQLGTTILDIFGQFLTF